MSAISWLLNSLRPRELLYREQRGFLCIFFFTLRQIKVLPFACGLCWEKGCALQSEQAALRLTSAGNKAAQGHPKGAEGLGTLVREQPQLRESTLSRAAFTSKDGTYKDGMTATVSVGSSSAALGFVCFRDRRSPLSVGNLLSGWSDTFARLAHESNFKARKARGRSSGRSQPLTGGGPVTCTSLCCSLTFHFLQHHKEFHCRWAMLCDRWMCREAG